MAIINSVPPTVAFLDTVLQKCGKFSRMFVIQYHSCCTNWFGESFSVADLPTIWFQSSSPLATDLHWDLTASWQHLNHTWHNRDLDVRIRGLQWARIFSLYLPLDGPAIELWVIVVVMLCVVVVVFQPPPWSWDCGHISFLSIKHVIILVLCCAAYARFSCA